MLRRLTIARTLNIIIWLLLPVIGARVQTDTDMWWHLRSGEQNLAAGRIVEEEQFSYTCPGADGCAESRLQHEWLSQPLLVAFWKLLGGAGMGIYAILCAMLGMAFINASMAGGPYLKAFLLALGAFSASIFWGARPLMLSFILAAVTLWIVYNYHRQGRTRLVWVLPLMFALWGNLHGGWPQGALILMAAAAGMVLNVAIFRRASPRRYDDTYGAPMTEAPAPDLRRELRTIMMFIVPCALAAVLIPLLNPYGVEMLNVPIDTVGFDFQPIFIEEWRPPVLTRPEMLPYFAVLGLTVLVMALDWRRADFVEIVMVAGVAYMSLGAARHIAFFTQIALIPLSIHAANLGADRGIRFARTTTVTPMRARVNVLLLGLIGLTAAMYLFVLFSQTRFEETMRKRLPVDALAAMREQHAPPNLFNSWSWGGYLIYFAPEYKVFIDGRADLYRGFTWTFICAVRGDPRFREMSTTDAMCAERGEPEWKATFADWDIHTVLIEPKVPIADVLRTEPDWRIAYEDEVAVVFVRDTAYAQETSNLTP